MSKSIERFSGRVRSYLRSRPSYPRQIIEVLQRECGLNRNSIIADIGCGTGFLAELFLQAGNLVYGIEPNQEMLRAAEEYLSQYTRFQPQNGTAENTRLSGKSIDFIVVGQAFHWFDPSAARGEFERIMRPGGWVVIIWNFRRESATPLMKGYEKLLKSYGTDYLRVHRRQKDTGKLLSAFGEDFFKEEIFHWDHPLDEQGFNDRLLSSSYVPPPDSPRSRAMLDEAGSLFNQNEESGKVIMKYETALYFGRLAWG